MSGEIIMKGAQVYGGSTLTGFSVGVLVIETRHPLLPGNLQDARTFSHPVLYGRVRVPDGLSLSSGHPDILGAIITAAQDLADQGVGALVGACGSFGFYQREVAKSFDLPVFMSIMTQVPFILQSLGPHRKLCVVAAWRAALDLRLFEACGITDTTRLVIKEMAGQQEFERMLSGEGSIDPDALRLEVLSVISAAVREEPQIGGIVLQCSDLPPFAFDVHNATGLPVFDAALLIEWVQMAVERRPYMATPRLQPWRQKYE